MKTLFISIQTILLCIGTLNAQDLFTTKKGTISFYSYTPVENIDATSNQASSAINLKTKQVYFKAPITSFEFQAKLMQEHFNENYLESDKYPVAEFSGTVIEQTDISQPGFYQVTIGGKLKMHGVVKEYKIPAVIVHQNGKVSANCQFMVKLTDHKIEVPTLVFSKIAESIEVKVQAEYVGGTVTTQR